MIEEALLAAPNHPTFLSQLQNPVEFPELLDYIWGWFLELAHTGRVYANGVAMPLSNAEIWAWCQLNDVRLLPWERRTFRLLDVAWLHSKNARD